MALHKVFLKAPPIITQEIGMNEKLAEVLAHNKALGDLFEWLSLDPRLGKDPDKIADWIVNTLQAELKYRGLKLKGLRCE